jgi:hypothetical protein
MGTLKRKLKAAQQREKRIKEREKVKKKKKSFELPFSYFKLK